MTPPAVGPTPEEGVARAAGGASVRGADEATATRSPDEAGASRSPDEAGATRGADEDTGPARDDEGVARAPVLRPFLLTAGRVAGVGDGDGALPVETQVVTTAEGLAALDGLSFERRDIVALCRQPQSLAEIAAALRLHLNVVRVLAADLEACGRLSVYVPTAGTARDISVLRRVIDGLRGIPDSGRTRRDAE